MNFIKITLKINIVATQDYYSLTLTVVSNTDVWN